MACQNDDEEEKNFDLSSRRIVVVVPKRSVLLFFWPLQRKSTFRWHVLSNDGFGSFMYFVYSSHFSFSAPHRRLVQPPPPRRQLKPRSESKRTEPAAIKEKKEESKKHHGWKYEANVGGGKAQGRAGFVPSHQNGLYGKGNPLGGDQGRGECQHVRTGITSQKEMHHHHYLRLTTNYSLSLV
jgi:hypothetical protein